MAVFNYRGTAEARFWRRVQKTDGCWLWTAGKTKGYGQIVVMGKKVAAPYYAYTTLVGPVPPGLCILHSCDVRACVRPDHLFLGTRADNNADRDRKGRHIPLNGARNPHSKMTVETVQAIRALRGQMTSAAVGERFGIHFATVCRIWRGEAWKHLK